MFDADEGGDRPDDPSRSGVSDGGWDALEDKEEDYDDFFDACDQVTEPITPSAAPRVTGGTISRAVDFSRTITAY